MRSDSLEAIPTRLATEGQVLAVHTFLDGTVGFAPPEAARRFQKFGYHQTGLRNRLGGLARYLFHLCRATPPVPAIYVPDRTCVILKSIPPELQIKYTVQREEGAALIETHGNPGWFRFANGRQIYVRDLPEGMLLEVLSLAETEYAMCEQDLAMHS